MKQQKIRTAILLLLTAFLLPAAAMVRTPDAIQVELEDDSLSQLEARLKTIDAELPQLARFNMRSGAGSVGHSSRFYGSNSAWSAYGDDVTNRLIHYVQGCAPSLRDAPLRFAPSNF